MAKVRTLKAKSRVSQKPRTWEGPEETRWVMKLAKEAEREIKQRKFVVTTKEDFIKMNWGL